MDGIPPYFVFWDLTLDQLCEELPRDDEALSGIHRFGGQETRDKYGEDVLEIIDSWVKERLDKGLPLVPATTSVHQQGEYPIIDKLLVPEDPSKDLFGGMLGDSPWTRILGDLYESFYGANRKATKKHIGDRAGCKRKNVNSVLSRMKELDFFDEDALQEGKYMLDPTKPKVGSLIVSLAELEGGHRSQEVEHRIKHLMKHRRSSQPDVSVKIGDREIEIDAKKLIGFSSQIDSAIQKELFDAVVDSREILSRLESIRELKERLVKSRTLQTHGEYIDGLDHYYDQLKEFKVAYSDSIDRLASARASLTVLMGRSTLESSKDRLEEIVETWGHENTRISTEDAIALTTQVLLEFSPDEDDGGPAWVGRADLFEQMKKNGFNGSSSRFSQILTKMVEREKISGRHTGEQGGREYRMKPDLWLMYRLMDVGPQHTEN